MDRKERIRRHLELLSRELINCETINRYTDLICEDLCVLSCGLEEENHGKAGFHVNYGVTETMGSYSMSVFFREKHELDEYLDRQKKEGE